MREKMLEAVIRKLIFAHIRGNDELFNEWANYAADDFEKNGDRIGARLTRDIIAGKYGNLGVNKGVTKEGLHE